MFSTLCSKLCVKKNNKGRFKIQPSYTVDYEINLEVLEKYTESVDNHWVHLIGGCKDINDLPNDLKEQVVKCFPRFFEEYPQYQNAECLNY